MLGIGRGLFACKRKNMNREKIENERTNGWKKATTLGGEVRLHTPEDLSPRSAASTIINLLQSTYINHAISQNPSQVEQDIRNGKVEPWIVTRDNNPVACAALVHQGDGSVELGRAVSIENGSGVGKIAMLSAVLNKRRSSIIAEVRLADEFANVPGSEATQRICLGLLELTPHAFLPAFSHGDPNRNELFGFSGENVQLINNSPILTAKRTIANRSTQGSIGNLKLVQAKPFRVAVSDENGQSVNSIVQESRADGAGCTLIPLEVTDQNMATINTLLNSDFTISGLDRKLGPNKLPVIWLATIGRGTLVAPTHASECLPISMRREIAEVADKFNTLART
jgi:hypothetical protein